MIFLDLSLYITHIQILVLIMEQLLHGKKIPPKLGCSTKPFEAPGYAPVITEEHNIKPDHCLWAEYGPC
jgi:hypothetical protein